MYTKSSGQLFHYHFLFFKKSKTTTCRVRPPSFDKTTPGHFLKKCTPKPQFRQNHDEPFFEKIKMYTPRRVHQKPSVATFDTEQHTLDCTMKYFVFALFLLLSGPFALGQPPVPTFSHEAGFYDLWLPLALTGPADCTMRYTTDGDSVTAQSATYVAGQPLALDKTTVVRARCYPTNGNSPGPIVTHTYLLNERTELPVVSLSVVPRHFWDGDSGIYMFGPGIDTCDFYPYPCANFWQGWERPVFVEIFDQKKRVVAQRASIEVTGGWSKANPKKGLLLGFNDDVLGDGTVKNVALLPDKPHITSWKKLHLRPGGNGATGLFHQDAWLQRCTRHLHSDYMAYRPAHIFLNGEYWGIYELRERQDEHFVQYNHGVDRDSVDVLRFPSGGYYNQTAHEAQAGTDEQWLRTVSRVLSVSPSSSMFYGVIESEFDLDNYIDYFAFQTFVANNDWLGPWRNNIRTWRPQGPDGRWRYMLWDLDAGMGEQWDYQRYTPCFNMIHYARNPDNVPWAQSEHSDMLDQMLRNRQFQVRFANRYADLLNTELQPTVLGTVLGGIRRELENDIERNFGKWGSDKRAWLSRIDNSLTWARSRHMCIWQHLVTECRLNKVVKLTLRTEPPEAGRIRINSVGPFDEAWSGHYFDGAPVQIEVEANPGWRFERWVASVPLDQPDSLRITQNFGQSSEVVAYFLPADFELVTTEQAPAVRVFPNPSSDVVLAKSSAALGRCALYDASGRRVATYETDRDLLIFSMESLPIGVYFLKGENWSEAVRVVRQ
jgi:hypothetical protein